MSEQLEIVFTDRAGASTTPQSNPSAPDSGNSPLDRTPGPADRVVGPKKPDSQGIGRDLESAAQKIANALGIGGLTGTALELRKAFGRLYESVTASATAVESKRRADSGGPPAPAEAKSAPSIPKAQPVTGPPVPKPGFEDKGFKYDEVTKSIRPMTPAEQDERAKGSLPSLGKQGFRYDPVSQRVGIPKVTGPVAPPVNGAGVPGVPVAPPVVGPMAGAGTAASGMARLAAAAGPAAIAVGVLVGAVVAGAAAIKKTVDVLHSESQRLGGLSGPLSGANARNEIRSEFADMRRAARVGPQLARFEDSRGQIMSKLADVNTEILKVVVELLNALQPAIPPLVNGIGVVAAAIPVQVDLLTAIWQVATGDWPAAAKVDAEEMKNLTRLTGAIKKLVENELDDMKGEDDPFTNALLSQFGAVQPTRRERIRAGRRERGGA